jgi:UDP-N-acetylmuramoylalanine--D-glutamate ligase
MVVKENRICYQGSAIEINEDEILLKGQHNVYNIGVAYCVARYFGIGDKDFYDAVKTFKPLPHRMEYVGEVEGVKYFNDSISTCCETTIQAVNSIKNIDTVILGGMDRGIEYKPLVDYLLDSVVRNLILMPDTGHRIQNLIINSNKASHGKNIFLVSNLEEAVRTAKAETLCGKTCLFSPAAASYGFFKNFEERGDLFKKLVMG